MVFILFSALLMVGYANHVYATEETSASQQAIDRAKKLKELSEQIEAEKANPTPPKPATFVPAGAIKVEVINPITIKKTEEPVEVIIPEPIEVHVTEVPVQSATSSRNSTSLAALFWTLVALLVIPTAFYIYGRTHRHPTHS